MKKAVQFFWTYVMVGFMLFGIGPALLMVASLFSRYGWELNFKKDTWLFAWQAFKANFKRGNILFFTYGLILAPIFYAYLLAQHVFGFWGMVFSIAGVGLLTWLTYLNSSLLFFGIAELAIVLIAIFSKRLLGKLWLHQQL